MNAAVAFKDWAAICDAMGQGRQSIILRKGGLHEGREGFQFKHPEFVLFPTGFHEQLEKLRPGLSEGLRVRGARDGFIQFREFVRLEWHATVTDRAAAEAIAPFHLYRDEVVRERFDYDECPGLQIAFARVYRLTPPWELEERPGFGGCRSWITLPSAIPANAEMKPALSDEQHASLAERLDAWRANFDISASRFDTSVPA